MATGRIVLLAALMKAEVLPRGEIMLEPWPEVVTPRKKALNQAKRRQRERRRAYKRRRKAPHRRTPAA